MALTPPWVNFKSNVNDNINKDGAVLLSVTIPCILDGIFISNQTNGKIIVDIKLMRFFGIVQKDFYFLKNVTLQPFEGRNIYGDGVTYLEVDDVIYASSDGSSNLFSAVVSYRELNELAFS